MKPTTEILARISQNSLANKEEVFTKLYRYLLRPDIYFVAYKNLYANNGAATKGVNEDTADGFSEAKIDSIIKALADETYQPMPVRRTYIQKKNNRKKLRPLGIPTFTDKLVQEVLRMILEAVYEPIFLDVSHGFRPKRSCHTALKQLRREFNGTRWFVEGDIKGCFDNINHAVLVGLLNNKIKDARITKLIYKFLKAGYLENWQYHKTYSGTPQGGIISPLLANIYLHELDKFVMKLKARIRLACEWDEYTPEYNGNCTMKSKRLSYRLIERLTGDERKLVHWQEYKAQIRQKLMSTSPVPSQTDKKAEIHSVCGRFLIAVNGKPWRTASGNQEQTGRVYR
ncbi:MAG: reverse transcriptase domain-containing protein [Oscillospiraceae bacterium]